MRRVILLFGVLMLAVGCAAAQGNKDAAKPKYETATFAGGCFWCMQPPFDKAKGVASTVVGYTGGKEKSPTYEEVSYGRTTHREAILVKYDPAKISYAELVDIFWRNIDPTQANGQFADIGTQYHTAIFYHSEEQKRIAEESKQKLAASGRFSKPIVVEILPASQFYPAEEYHQKYYQKNPVAYKRYAIGSGRYPFIERVWGEKKD